jgi:hypothetical protein
MAIAGGWRGLKPSDTTYIFFGRLALAARLARLARPLTALPLPLFPFHRLLSLRRAPEEFAASMLVFYWSGGRQGWSMGPLLALLPLALQFAAPLLNAASNVGYRTLYITQYCSLV